MFLIFGDGDALEVGALIMPSLNIFFFFYEIDAGKRYTGKVYLLKAWIAPPPHREKKKKRGILWAG